MAKKDLQKVSGKSAQMDLQIATGIIGMALLSPQGLQQIGNMLKTAKDPVQVVAHMIFMAMFQARKALQQKGLKLDARIWIAGGGVIDRVIFELMGVLYSVFQMQEAGDKKFVAAVKEAVLNLMHDNQEASSQDEGSPEEEAQESPEEEGQEQEQAPQGGGLLAAGGPPQGMPSGGAGQAMRG